MDSACDTPLLEWVSPFGDPRIKACSRLPGACRSVPRPSSPLGAKASTRCPCFPRPPPATTTPCTPPSLRLGGDPARRRTAPTKRRQMRRPPPGTIPASTANYKCRPPVRRSQQAASIPMPNMRPAADRKKKAGAHDLPAPAVPRRMQESLLACPHDGHLVTTSRCPRNMRRYPGPKGRRRADGVPLRAAGPGPGHDGRTSPRGSEAWWAWADLNGRPHAYQACALTS